MPHDFDAYVIDAQERQELLQGLAECNAQRKQYGLPAIDLTQYEELIEKGVL